YTHILKQVVDKGGKKFAIITTTAAGGTPQEGESALTQDLTGTSRFDIERGTLVSGQYTLNVSLRAGLPQMPGGAGGAGAALGGGQVDGLTNITVAEAPADP